MKRARLEVRKGARTLDALHLDDLEQVVLCGMVQVTVQALRALLKRGVDTAFLTQGGSFLGRLSGPVGKNVELRRLQYRRLEDPTVALDLARRFVGGKLRNQRALLIRRQRELSDDRIARALVSMRHGLAAVPEAGTLDVVRGVEGKGAADYFRAYGALFSAPGIEFKTRIRRPPPDPVNILLSFGYTLLGNVIQGFVELAGLDPHLGTLHAPDYGRPSLALDLMEEMRPVLVDAAVVTAFNSKSVSPRDFVPAGDGDAPVEEEWEREEAEEGAGSAPARRLLLRPEAAKRWITAFERRLSEEAHYPAQGRRFSYRQILREQVYLFARHLKGEEEYCCFEYRP